MAISQGLPEPWEKVGPAAWFGLSGAVSRCQPKSQCPTGFSRAFQGMGWKRVTGREPATFSLGSFSMDSPNWLC
jgi:hypothetical protein